MRAYLVCGCLLLVACSAALDLTDAPSSVLQQVLAKERGALDRWGKGDPGGYLDIYAPDATYFDPGLEKRIDGHDSLATYLGPFKGKIKVASYDIVDPKVQTGGDLAVFTFNIVNHDAQGKVMNRWNVTEVYRRAGRDWKIIHSHFSLTKPELKQPAN
jgi:ketosteroid isomerase-like protein